MLANKVAPGVTLASALFLLAAPARAEITVLDRNALPIPLLAPLSLQVGGSARPGFIWNRGPEPDYNRRGFDGGTRFRFTGDYALSQQTSLVGYYEWGVDLGHMLHLHGNYDPDGDRDTQRQLYGGIKDARFGTLTFGHQYGAYYDAVGVKSDVWDNDGNASANWIGVGGDYDGGERPRDALKYVNSFGDFTLYADYLLPLDEALLDDDLRLRRNHGQGIGVDYQAGKTLTLSAAWSQNLMTVKDLNGDSRRYHQRYAGTAVTWQPGSWYLTSTATWYRNYVPSQRASVQHYFAGDGYGLESFAGYTFQTDRPWLHSIQPYLAVDTLRLTGSEHYHASRLYLGMYAQIACGFSVYLEHAFVSATDNRPDTTWLSVYYDF